MTALKTEGKLTMSYEEYLIQFVGDLDGDPLKKSFTLEVDNEESGLTYRFVGVVPVLDPMTNVVTMNLDEGNLLSVFPMKGKVN